MNYLLDVYMIGVVTTLINLDAPRDEWWPWLWVMSALTWPVWVLIGFIGMFFNEG